VNFLLIQTDQQRRDSLGVYGNSIARTPAIDRLAAEGVVFDYAFTPTPICGPSRASLITGKRPCRHGILFNAESGSVAGRDFMDKQVTVAEILRERGYRSTICGKWHVGTALPPSACGFEGVFYPGYGYPDRHPHYLAYLETLGADFTLREPFHGRRPGGAEGPLLAAIQDGPEEASVPHYLVTQAIETLRRSAALGEPFLLRVDFWGPHAPYIIPERYARMYDPKQIPPWPNFEDDLAGKPRIQRITQRYWGVQDFTWREWSRLVAMCYGYVSLIDDQVARLLAALEETGLAGDTAVFFTSDHGGMVGGHGLADKGPHLYDEIVRVPLIARLPGAISRRRDAAVPGCVRGELGTPSPPRGEGWGEGRGFPLTDDPTLTLPSPSKGEGSDATAPGCVGRRTDALAYNLDLMPTILELAGCDIPDDLDARSLVPLFSGERDRVRDDDTALVEFHGHQAPYAQRLVRTRSAKYVFNAPETDELYDLDRDPGELTNLAPDPGHAGLLREMRLLLREHLAATGDPILRFFDGTRL